jgi:deoxyribodipyrimidine photo-lyase
MIHESRVQHLRAGGPDSRGGFVLLWVQASVRVTDNHALEYAVREANRLGLPLAAVFGLTPSFPEANARHYQFLLEGLRDLSAGLAARGIPFSVRLGSPPEVVLAASAGAEALIPVQTTSPKQEYAARTIRPKIHRLWHDYFVPLEPHELKRQAQGWPTNLDLPQLDVSDPSATVKTLPLDFSVPPGREAGGEVAALARLSAFVGQQLAGYADTRNDPTQDGSSRLSAFLHYGQLSPLTAALAAREQGGPGADTFLEELIVRRELSFNLCQYNPHYDTYDGLPDWAKKTLEEHAGDRREALYTREQLDRAETHDPYWNASQNEMVRTGRMHNYMRMYWGKKVLEWTETPREAHAHLIALNNRYEQDGRNANSFAGISWVFGLHDRPWTRRPIFGTVRYMNAGGLGRKFDIETYARRWA